MLKKILIAIDVILMLGTITLIISTSNYFVKAATQPKIIAMDESHTTFSWGFYVVGSVMAFFTVLAIAVTIIYSIVAYKKYKKHTNKQ